MINRGQGIRGGFKPFLTVVSSSIIVQTHADTLTRDDMGSQTQLVRQFFLLDFVPLQGVVVGRSGTLIDAASF